MTPLTDGRWVVGRVLASLGVVVPVVALVAVLAVTVGRVHLSVATWLSVLLVAFAGAVPIALLGLVLGLTLRAESAQAAQAVVFLALAVLGGMFSQGTQVPATIAPLAAVTPSHHLVQAFAGGRGRPPAMGDLAALVVFPAVAGGVVVWLAEKPPLMTPETLPRLTSDARRY